MLTTRWFAAVSVLLGACSGTVSTPAPQTAKVQAEPAEAEIGPVHKRGGEKLIVTVGRAGGTLELQNGARLEIPSGALSENTEITFAEGGKTTAFSNRDYEHPIGPTLEVAPALTPGAPFKVSIPLTRLPEEFSENDLTLAAEVLSNQQRAVEMTGVQTRWDYLPAASADGRVAGELSEVPGMRIQFLVSRGN